jgi:hypothetical protein
MFDDLSRQLKKIPKTQMVPIQIQLDDERYLDRRCPGEDLARGHQGGDQRLPVGVLLSIGDGNIEQALTQRSRGQFSSRANAEPLEEIRKVCLHRSR